MPANPLFSRAHSTFYQHVLSTLKVVQKKIKPPSALYLSGLKTAFINTFCPISRIFNKKQPFLCKHKGLFFIAYSALISLLSRRLLDDCSNTSSSYCTATLTALESCFLWCSPCFLWLKSVFFRQFGSWYFYLPEFLAPFWHRKGADYTYKLEFLTFSS